VILPLQSEPAFDLGGGGKHPALEIEERTGLGSNEMRDHGCGADAARGTLQASRAATRSVG
jgi:hypothetical protein